MYYPWEIYARVYNAGFVECNVNFILSSNTESVALQKLLNLDNIYFAIYKIGVILSISFLYS